MYEIWYASEYEGARCVDVLSNWEEVRESWQVNGFDYDLGYWIVDTERQEEVVIIQ